MVKFKVIKDDDYNGLEIEGEYDNRDEAELRLVDVVANTVSNFDEYEYEDIDTIIKRGYENYGAGTIYIEEDGIKPL